MTGQEGSLAWDDALEPIHPTQRVADRSRLRIGARPEDIAPGWGAVDVRRQAAADADTERWLLALLARDPDHRVRAAAAENRRTPVQLLTALAFDDHRQVRHALALNPATPADLIGLLLDDGDAEVRASAVRHPNNY